MFYLLAHVLHRRYKELYSDKSQRRNLWGLISLYLESAEELLESTSNERLGDYHLIGKRELFDQLKHFKVLECILNRPLLSTSFAEKLLSTACFTMILVEEFNFSLEENFFACMKYL